MLSRFGDIWIDCTYIYTSDWGGSCSEEGPLFGGASPRPLHVDPYSLRREAEKRNQLLLFCFLTMKINPLALLPLLVAAGGAADLQPLPLNADDFDQPAWETSERSVLDCV